MAQQSRRLLRVPGAPTPRVLAGVSRELVEVQRQARDATRQARQAKQTRGRRITVTLPATANVVVAHGLGRLPEAYVQEEVISGTPAYTLMSKTTRLLTFTSTAAAAAVVRLWVY